MTDASELNDETTPKDGEKGEKDSDSTKATNDEPVVGESSVATIDVPLQTGKRRVDSSVSFKEDCETFERPKHKSSPKKPPILRSVRYYIMLLALVSPFVTTYSKTIINFAITDMIDVEYLESQQKSKPQSTTTTTTMSPLNDTASSTAYFDHDNSCPVTDEQRDRLMRERKEDKSRSSSSEGEKFQWDTDKQGYLKAAYSMGHAILQIAGGRLSEIYGSHYIMSASSLLIGILCLIAPFMATLHVNLLFMDLFVLGMLGSFMTPSLITLFNNWLTKSEKSMTLSLYLVSSRLGYAFSSLLCGVLIGANISWRYLFFSAGWTGLVFATSFFFLATSRPQDHMFMTPLELDYLASKNTLVKENLVRDKEKKLGKSEPMELKGVNIGCDSNSGQPKASATKSPKASAPWLAILTNIPVWAFVVTKFCVKLSTDTVQIELPTYLKRVMHFSPNANGNLNSLNYVVFSISCLTVGTLAKSINKNRPFGMSKTTTRKLFQGISSFGVSLVLLGNSMSVCNETGTISFLVLMFFITTFGTGGEAQIPLDISERYSGTIHAIGSSIAISGAIAPIIIGYFLQGYYADRDRWASIWIGASAISAVGGFVFVFFGDAKIQPFDSIGLEQRDESGSDKERVEKATKAMADNKAFEKDEPETVQVVVDKDESVEKPYRESGVI